MKYRNKVSSRVLVLSMIALGGGSLFLSSKSSNAQVVYQCKACPAGSYSSSETGYKCKKCGKGTYSSSVASTSCSKCPIGQYARTEGSTGCKSCEVGFWCNENGFHKCKSGFENVFLLNRIAELRDELYKAVMAPYNESLGYSEISKNDLSNILKNNMYAESDSSILYYMLNDIRVSYFNAYMKPVQKQTTTNVMTVNKSFQNGGLGTVTSGIMDRTAGNVTADYGVKRVVENAGRLNGGLIGGGSGGGLIGGGSGGSGVVTSPGLGKPGYGSGDNGIWTPPKPDIDFGNITFGGEGSGKKIKDQKPQEKIKVDANYIYDKAKKLVDAMIEEYNGSSDCNSIVKNGAKYDTYGDDRITAEFYTNFKDVLTVYIFNFSFMYSKFIEGKLGGSDKNILNLYKRNFIVNWDGTNLYSFNLAIKSIVEKLFNSKSYQLTNILLRGEEYNNNDNFIRFICDLAYNYDILVKYKEHQCSRVNLFGHQEPGNGSEDLFP